jgi:hypothetical protein
MLRGFPEPAAVAPACRYSETESTVFGWNPPETPYVNKNEQMRQQLEILAGRHETRSLQHTIVHLLLQCNARQWGHWLADASVLPSQ